MKRIFGVLLIVTILIVSCTTAYAITGYGSAQSDVEFRETGIATFILDNSGKIVGALKPDEDLKKLGFQNCKKSGPTNLEDGKALRRRAYARVILDENYKVIEGGKNIEVTIVLTNYYLVAQILGDEFTVADIIDATIYSPNLDACNTRAAHMFLPQGSDRVKVGRVIFKCGKCLDLYVGNFDCDCDLELGFRAVVQKEPEKVPGCIEPPNHCGPIKPACNPCGPSVVVTTNTEVTTTVVTTVDTTTTTIVTGNDCGHGPKPGPRPCPRPVPRPGCGW